jgi:hypothetical protein
MLTTIAIGLLLVWVVGTFIAATADEIGKARSRSRRMRQLGHIHLPNGQNHPKPDLNYGWTDWDRDHPWADGSPVAGMIAALRRDVREGLTPAWDFQFCLDEILAGGDYGAQWPAHTRRPKTAESQRANRLGRERLRAKFENDLSGVIVFDQGATWTPIEPTHINTDGIVCMGGGPPEPKFDVIRA